MDLIKHIKEANLIKTGDFTLKSGLKSNLYFDFKGLISYPKLVSDISYELSKLITDDEVCIAGVPMGGIIYTSIISQIKNLPMVLIRDEKKNYGTLQQIEGNTFNKDLVLIEDVITTGMSVINTLEILKSNNINVKQILCILDRESGGVQKISEMGYNITSLFKMSDILNEEKSSNIIKITNSITQKLIEIIKLKHSNLIVSLDIINEDELLNKLELIGEHICAVKIHYDIISNLSIEFSNKINNLKRNKNFVIIEDRKFADIPYISLKQLENLKQFADIITVHGICGEKLIEELNKTDIGILLIHQLSIENNLIDNIYSNKVKDMANKFNNVVGFISQKKVLNDYLTFTPGINLNTKTDGMGQTYKNISNHADIFIVGRGIYESNNIIESAIMYKELCFKQLNLL